MEILMNLNERVKRFSIVDLKLAQLFAVFAALIIVKLIPQIMNINIGWFAALFVICLTKPVYVLLIKK